MKMTKKIAAIILSAMMLLSVVACGDGTNTNGDAGGSENATGNTNNGSGENQMPDGFVLKNDEEDVVPLGTPAVKLDPKEVYGKITYTQEMFYGKYELLGNEEARDKFGAESEYFTWTYQGDEIMYSELPFKFEAGEHTIAHSLSYVEEYEWMRVYFMKKTDTGNYLDTIMCAYSVDGNTLTLNPVDTFNVDTESKKITYEFSEEVWEYKYEFCGRNLTLSTDSASVTMTAGLDPYGEYDYLYVDHYVTKGSPTVGGIDQITFRYSGEDGSRSLYFETVDGEDCYNGIGVLQENGLITFTVPLESGTETYELVYFYGYDDGIVLTDGTNTYYYNDNYSDRNMSVINDYLTEDQTEKLEELSELELENIVEKKEDLMADLTKAFNDAGIKVTVDEKNGELAMDSSVLFGGDSGVLTDEGKAFLNKFVGAYTSIVFSEKYENFVSKTMVEGHTAPVAGSTYESGMPLSVERANNVKDYCVSSETGVDTTKLAAALEAVGYSNSKPIYDADGNVDMNASRRVSFRFIINLDNQ